MTNEQRKAIENLSEINNLSKEELQNENITAILDYEDLKSLDTVLSLIKEQQEKIAKYEKIYKEYDCYRWVKELDKKDKQIDLMAKEITMTKPTPCTRTNEFSMGRMYMSKEEIKQYFADLVEKE